MKKISRFVSILAVLLFAVSCQNSDIDGGQTINKGKLNLTATIVSPDATRVTYAVDNESLHKVTPSWSDNDKIIGWDDLGQTFTFTVSDVDGSGNATLDAGTYDPGTATKLYAIYAPGKTVSSFEGSGSARTLAIDLSAQNGVLDDDSPVLMCATATITAGCASLNFVNQTAIIGITKFKVADANTEIKQLSLSGLKAKGTFQISDEKLVFTPAASPTTLNVDGSWTADASGKVTTALYFAALPTASASLRLDASSATKTYSNAAAIPTTSIVAGNYYYMAKNLTPHEAAIGAKTYATIGEAWAVANASTVPVTVTLLNDCTAASTLTLDDSASGTGEVTLDLNGKTLTGPTASYTLNIRAGRVFTLTDNSSDVVNNQGVVNGNNVGNTIYVTASTVEIKGGTIVDNAGAESKYALYLASTSGATISGGKLKSPSYRGVYVGKDATLDISGGEINSQDFCVYNYNKTTVTGGIFETTSTATITSNGTNNGENAVVAVSGGYFSSTSKTVELFTYSSSAKCYVQSAFTDRPVNNARAYTIDGKTAMSNRLNPNAETKADYPYEVGAFNRYYYTQVPSYNYNHANFASAANHANSINSDVTLQVRTTVNGVGAVDLNNPGHTITLDLNGKTLSTTAASFITASNKVVITSSVAGGTISSTKNNVIVVSNAASEVTISNCKVTSSCAKGEENSSVRTIRQTNGTLSIENATIISEKSTAVYANNGTTTIEGATITSQLYGVYATTTADVELKGDANSVYSVALRAVYSGSSNAKISIEGGYYYTESGNAVSAYSAEIGAKYVITGGYFSSISSNLSDATGYSNIVTLSPAETHSHDATHADLSYGYGYKDSSEGEASLDEPVANYGGAQTGINF